MNPICKIWGHNYRDDASTYGVFVCHRCARVTDFNEEVVDDQSLGFAVKAYRIRNRLSTWLYNKFRWFFKCHDCGKRCGKHDDSCVPF